MLVILTFNGNSQRRVQVRYSAEQADLMEESSGVYANRAPTAWKDRTRSVHAWTHATPVPAKMYVVNCMRGRAAKVTVVVSAQLNSVV